MQKSFSNLLQQLKKIIFLYDGKQVDEKIKIIKVIAQKKWKTAEDLHAYSELLLFIATHPENNEIAILVEMEFERIAGFFSNSKNQKNYTDLGFPFTEMYTQLSHDILCWLNNQKCCKLSIESFDESGIDLNTILKATLLNIEKEETTAGLSNEDLLNTLKIKPANQFDFLLKEFSKLNNVPYAKDYLWDSIKLWVTIKSIDKKYSRIYNRIAVPKLFYQQEITKKFDYKTLINTPVGAAKKITEKERSEIVSVIKNSLTLTMRETDPATYMNENSLQFYELEKGISVALYGMEANRQLALQSYIGYTLFKNGYPIAYGGSWIFGTYAKFGLNIFEAFRGGESGFVMCELLRVYKQVFGLKTIEVDAYMFGRNNADGIASGAFWFYYRFGFRLMDKNLQQLAEKELKKINATIGYRTPAKILLKFAESDAVLEFENTHQLNRTDILEKISTMIATEFNGNRLIAEKKCVEQFIKKSKTIFLAEHQFALTEFALTAKAMQWNTASKIKHLTIAIQSKATDAILFNNTLKELVN